MAGFVKSNMQILTPINQAGGATSGFGLADLLQAGLMLFLKPLVAGLVVTFFLRKVFLFHMMARKIMGIFVPLAMLQPFGARIVGIFEVVWHLKNFSALYITDRFLNSDVRSV